MYVHNRQSISNVTGTAKRRRTQSGANEGTGKGETSDDTGTAKRKFTDAFAPIVPVVPPPLDLTSLGVGVSKQHQRAL